MKILTAAGALVLFLVWIDGSHAGAVYLIKKVELNDKRMMSAITEYIKENALDDVEGVILLKYDRDSVDNFYLGYMVYNHLREMPPSFYAVVGNKLVMIYSGLESYLSFKKASFKLIEKDCNHCFAEGLVIVEPAYWKITLTKDIIRKEVIDKLPY